MDVIICNRKFAVLNVGNGISLNNTVLWITQPAMPIMAKKIVLKCDILWAGCIHSKYVDCVKNIKLNNK